MKPHTVTSETLRQSPAARRDLADRVRMAATAPVAGALAQVDVELRAYEAAFPGLTSDTVEHAVLSGDVPASGRITDWLIAIRLRRRLADAAAT